MSGTGHRPASRVWHALTAAPWAIEPAMLGAVIDVAIRHDLDPGAAASIARRRTERAAVREPGIPESVAVIPVIGPTFRYADLFTEVSGATSIEGLRADFDAALDDPDVRGIAFVIDSPGGQVEGTNELAEAIYRARGRKPITAYIDGKGASAAYWLASACDVVVCDETAIVGSIGVAAAVPDPDKDDSGMVEIVSSQSPNKRSNPHTESGRARIQATADALADVFVAKVARNRGVSTDDVLTNFGRGGVLVGRAAKDAGLVDALGSFEQVVAELANGERKAGRPGVTVVRQHERRAPQRQEPAAAQAQEAGVSDPKEPTLWQRFVAAMGGPTEAPEAMAVPAVVAAGAPRAAPADPEKEALAARLAELEDERARERASAFADGEIGARRALPAERDALVGAYLDAARDDATGPAASVEGQPATRVERLVARQSARPPHDLTRELVPSGEGTRALDNPRTTPGGPETPPSAERIYQLWQRTPDLKHKTMEDAKAFVAAMYPNGAARR